MSRFSRLFSTIRLAATTGVVGAALGTQGLLGQTVVSGTTTYTFSSWGGAAGATFTSGGVAWSNDGTGGTGSSFIASGTGASSNRPLIDTYLAPTWNSGTFLNGSTAYTTSSNNPSAIRILFSAYADKNIPTGTTGAFAVVFDTSGDKALGSGDKGLAVNVSYSISGNTITLSQTSIYAFTLGGGFSLNAPTSATANISSASLLSSYSATLSTTSPADNTGYTIALGALLSDIDSTWKPVLGTTTLATVFTSNTITGSNASLGLYDWYGASGTAITTADLNVPEPSAWISSGTLLGMGAMAWWRRRRAVAIK